MKASLYKLSFAQLLLRVRVRVRVKINRLLPVYCAFEASTILFIMEIRREFSFCHNEPKSLCSVAEYARKFK